MGGKITSTAGWNVWAVFTAAHNVCLLGLLTKSLLQAEMPTYIEAGGVYIVSFPNPLALESE